MRDIPAIIIQAPQKSAWEEAISVGIELREAKDNIQWALGEWAEKNCQRFGGDSLKKLAAGIGIPYNSLREYRRVHLKIPPEMRIPHLSFRHHQKAADTDNPKEWLEKASDNGWTSEMLEMEISKSKMRLKEVKENKSRIEKCDVCGKWKLFAIPDNEICSCRY
jgi:hypothetical protein